MLTSVQRKHTADLAALHAKHSTEKKQLQQSVVDASAKVSRVKATHTARKVCRPNALLLASSSSDYHLRDIFKERAETIDELNLTIVRASEPSISSNG